MFEGKKESRRELVSLCVCVCVCVGVCVSVLQADRGGMRVTAAFGLLATCAGLQASST